MFDQELIDNEPGACNQKKQFRLHFCSGTGFCLSFPQKITDFFEKTTV